MSTREVLFSLLVLTQTCQDQQEDLFICFINFGKVFDRVKQNLLMNALFGISLDKKNITLLQNYYQNQSARIKIDESITQQTKIHKEVRHGCVLPPLLFNPYSELKFDRTLADTSDGIKVNGMNISNIRYANNTFLTADLDIGLQQLFKNVHMSCGVFGRKINTNETKVMSIKNHKQRIFRASSRLDWTQTQK